MGRPISRHAFRQAQSTTYSFLISFSIILSTAFFSVSSSLQKANILPFFRVQIEYTRRDRDDADFLYQILAESDVVFQPERRMIRHHKVGPARRIDYKPHTLQSLNQNPHLHQTIPSQLFEVRIRSSNGGCGCMLQWRGSGKSEKECACLKPHVKCNGATAQPTFQPVKEKVFPKEFIVTVRSYIPGI